MCFVRLLLFSVFRVLNLRDSRNSIESCGNGDVLVLFWFVLCLVVCLSLFCIIPACVCVGLFFHVFALVCCCLFCACVFLLMCWLFVYCLFGVDVFCFFVC